jgi:hypothetical protein
VLSRRSRLRRSGRGRRFLHGSVNGRSVLWVELPTAMAPSAFSPGIHHDHVMVVLPICTEVNARLGSERPCGIHQVSQ